MTYLRFALHAIRHHWSDGVATLSYLAAIAICAAVVMILLSTPQA